MKSSLRYIPNTTKIDNKSQEKKGKQSKAKYLKIFPGYILSNGFLQRKCGHDSHIDKHERQISTPKHFLSVYQILKTYSTLSIDAYNEKLFINRKKFILRVFRKSSDVTL